MTRKDLNKIFAGLSLEQSIRKFELPHRFLVYYASQCAKDAVQAYSKDPDPRTLKAIDITERFGLGEEIGQEELIKTANGAYAASYAAHAAAYAAASYASNAAEAASDAAAHAASDAAAHAAHAAAHAAHAAAHAAHAAYATYAAHAAHADRPKAEAKYKELLLDLIEKKLTNLEKVLLLS